MTDKAKTEGAKASSSQPKPKDVKAGGFSLFNVRCKPLSASYTVIEAENVEEAKEAFRGMVKGLSPDAPLEVEGVA